MQFMLRHIRNIFAKPDCRECIYCENIKGNSQFSKGWVCFLRNIAVDDMEKYHINTRRCFRKTMTEALKEYKERIHCVEDDDPNIPDE